MLSLGTRGSAGIDNPGCYLGAVSLLTGYCSDDMAFSDFIFPFSLSFPGFLLFKDYCLNEIDEAVPQLKFYEEVRRKALPLLLGDAERGGEASRGTLGPCSQSLQLHSGMVGS